MKTKSFTKQWSIFRFTYRGWWNPFHHKQYVFICFSPRLQLGIMVDFALENVLRRGMSIYIGPLNIFICFESMENSHKRHTKSYPPDDLPF